MSLNSGLNAKAVKTELDEILWSKYSEPPRLAGFGHADTPDLFKQEGIDRAEWVYQEHAGPGKWTKHAEEEDAEETSARSGNKTTKVVNNWKQDLPIPNEFYEDDQHDLVARDVRDMARQARNSQDEENFDIYAGGFATHTTPDAAYVFSASHTNLNGDTIGNLGTGALTPDNLATEIRRLYEQKDQRGRLGGHDAAALLVPPALIKKALQYTESELEPETADNQRNYISMVYPEMRVFQSPWLGATYYSPTTYADTAYFIVSREHQITRKIRKALSTTLVDWRYDKKDRWMYKGRFREVSYAATWEGITASNGSA